jgi:hypothetical protein
MDLFAFEAVHLHLLSLSGHVNPACLARILRYCKVFRLIISRDEGLRIVGPAMLWDKDPATELGCR